MYDVLFLCTGNSARSLLAECALGRLGGDRFRAHSAGSHPTGAPHPRTLELLRELGYDTSGLRSKSWEEFARPESPQLHFVFSVCDAAHGETCPIWPGAPLSAHWGVADPAAATGGEESLRRAFRRAYDELEQRIERFTRLPVEGLDRPGLQARLAEIGKAAR